MPASSASNLPAAAAPAPKTPAKRDSTPNWMAAVAFAMVAGTLYMAKPAADQWWIVGVSAMLVSVTTFIFQWREKSSVVGGILLGLAAGIWQSIDVIKYVEEGTFLLTFAALAVFLSLGLVFGAFIEFIFYMHGLFHRMRVMQ